MDSFALLRKGSTILAPVNAPIPEDPLVIDAQQL